MDLSRYYSQLGLPNNASLQEVKSAYRKLAFELHPDKNPGNEARFIEVKLAYEILTGKTKVQPSTIIHQEQTQRSSRAKSTHNGKTAQERYEEARRNYYAQKKKEQEADVRYYHNLLKSKKYKIAKYGSIFCLIVALLITVDNFYFPSSRFESKSITEDKQEQIIDEVNLQLKEMGYSEEEIEHLDENIVLTLNQPNYLIVKSMIFKDDVHFINKTYLGKQVWEKKIENDPLIALIFFLLLPSILLFYKKMNPAFTLLITATCYLILPLSIAVLGVNLVTLIQNL